MVKFENLSSDGEEEFVVEKIKDIRIKNRVKQYLVKWKGYSELVIIIIIYIYIYIYIYIQCYELEK